MAPMMISTLSPALKRFVDAVLKAYLDRKLQPKEVAQSLATHLEIDAARDVFDQLVQDGRIKQHEANSIADQLRATRSAETAQQLELE